MSKSYNNTIPLFEPAKKLRKLVMKIKTNSLEPGEPKDPDDCSTLFDIYKAVAELPNTQLHIGKNWWMVWAGVMPSRSYSSTSMHTCRRRAAEYNKLIADPGHVEVGFKAGCRTGP